LQRLKSQHIFAQKEQRLGHCWRYSLFFFADDSEDQGAIHPDGNNVLIHGTIFTNGTGKKMVLIWWRPLTTESESKTDVHTCREMEKRGE